MSFLTKLAGLFDAASERISTTFFSAIDDIRNRVTLKTVVERLERGDVSGAVDAVGLDPVAFEDVERAIAEAYTDGGRAEVENLPRVRDPSGQRVIFRFGVRNEPGEAWLREHSSSLVTSVVEDQRVAIRTALAEGLSEGRNPRSTALDVVGRIDRASNRRTGGIIGLTSQQERFVASARRELLSGDPAQLANYLSRERRDKRFDRAVAKAIKAGKPLDQETVSRVTGRYADRLLLLRGEMLARTETLQTLNKGRDDAIRQQIAAGKIEAQDVTKKWNSAGDGRVRHTHRALNGKTVAYDAAFVSPSGAQLRYPGDPEAPGWEIVGCRCSMTYKVSYIDALVRRRQAGG